MSIWDFYKGRSLVLRLLMGTLVGAILLTAVSAFAWFNVPVEDVRKNAIPIQFPNITGNCNNLGSNNGMMNCGTLNVAPLNRRLDSSAGEHLKEEILSFPKDKTYVVTSVWGDQEAFQLANDIYDFMKGNGFTVDGVNQAAFSRPVIGLVKENTSDGKIQIIVGARPN